MSVTFYALRRTAVEPLPGFRETRCIELGEDYDLNFANGNARLVLAALGLLTDESDLYGEATIPECRRAVMRARARLSTDASAYTRATEIEHGAPRVNEDGSVELRPVRVYSMGLDADGVCSRVERFALFVERAAECGATHVNWS